MCVTVPFVSLLIYVNADAVSFYHRDITTERRCARGIYVRHGVTKNDSVYMFHRAGEFGYKVRYTVY